MMPQQAAPIAAPVPAAPQAAPPAAPAAQSGPPSEEKLVMAGMTLMYDEKTREYLINGLKGPGDPTDKVAAEVVGLMRLLDEKSKGKIPKELIAPVARDLLLELVHFASLGGFFKLKKEQITLAMKKTIAQLMKQYGVFDEMQRKKSGPASPVSAPPAVPPQPAAPPAGIIQQAQGA